MSSNEVCFCCLSVTGGSGAHCWGDIGNYSFGWGHSKPQPARINHKPQWRQTTACADAMEWVNRHISLSNVVHLSCAFIKVCLDFMRRLAHRSACDIEVPREMWHADRSAQWPWIRLDFSSANRENVTSHQLCTNVIKSDWLEIL